MTGEEKRKYLTGHIIRKFLLSLIMSFIFSVIIFAQLSSNGVINGLLWFIIMFLCLFLLIFIIQLLYPINLFSKNLQMTDGYIYDRSQNPSSGETWGDLYGKAKTLDGSKITKAQSIPEGFLHGQIPVKILIYKNKARMFFITEESYAYVKENESELEKKRNNVSAIISIIAIIIFFIVFIMFFL